MISLSFCPDRALPWPMRGVQRWSEADLVRVNATILKIEQATAYLDFIWSDSQILTRLINMCLILEALDKDPVELSDAELQYAMDGFRRAHKLYTVEETHRWMERHGMSHEQLEHYVADEAKVDKLRNRVTAHRVEDYFAAHSADFDMACVAKITFPNEESAYQTYEQIRSDRMKFYEAAQSRVLTAMEHRDQPRGELFVVIQRGQASPELGAAIFAASPGAVLEPVRTEEGYALIQVLSLVPASLNERTCSAIKMLLFDQWLAERRQAARIEWYWGNVGQTSQTS